MIAMCHEFSYFVFQSFFAVGAAVSFSTKFVGTAMGRPKGTTEIIFDQTQVDEVSKRIIELMPDAVKGAAAVAPEKTFNEFATKSA